MPISINRDFLPLYVITHKDVVTEEEFEVYLKDVTRSMYEPSSHVCSTLEEALEWSEKRLAELGLAPPGHARSTLLIRANHRAI